MRSRAVVGVLLLALLLGGCRSAFVGRAENAYEQGRYLEVAEKLADYEGRLQRLPHAKKAIYAIYRGLALLKLGDYQGAEQWMRFAYDLERAEPSLAPLRRQRLDRGWEELQRLWVPRAIEP